MKSDEEVEQEITDKNSSQFASRLARFAFVPPTSGQGSKSTFEPVVRLPPKRSSISLKSPNKRSIDQLTNGSSTPSSGNKKVKVYDHLNDISDHLDFGLDIMFCGINPGEQSSLIGHHYANPTNHFWGCLHESGLTPRKLNPRQDSTLPKDFRYGLTNLVSRPTVEQSELSKSEQVSGVSVLLSKIRQYQPLIVCFVGLGITDVFKSVAIPKPAVPRGKKKSGTDSAGVGLQAYKLVHKNAHEGGQDIQEAVFGKETNIAHTRSSDPLETIFFAVSSTSGRVVRYKKQGKVRQFMNLKATLAQVKARKINTDSFIHLL